MLWCRSRGVTRAAQTAERTVLERVAQHDLLPSNPLKSTASATLAGLSRMLCPTPAREQPDSVDLGHGWPLDSSTW
jgi:hypothetical protein